MKDSLGDRIKDQYENRTRMFLPRRTYTIIRLDGKAFHTFTKDCNKPFDNDLIFLMNNTAEELCKNIQGAQFAYVQSDEISILLTDFKKLTSDAWFNGNIQKITSVSASMATAFFNERKTTLARFKFWERKGPAMFDSRVFTIPDINEVANYFIWRQNDASRNSINMVAQSLYSHKQLQGKSCSQMQDMIHEAGQNWNDYDVGKKRGRIVTQHTYNGVSAEFEGTVTRKVWTTEEPPIFTQDTGYLKSMIPKLGEE